MRIMIVHNRYQQAGGEDTVCAAEIALLRAAGHHVIPLLFDNDGITGKLTAARAALFTPYNPVSRKRVEQAIADNAPDVVHVHNWFPLASPSVFDACAAKGVPVVWTLHNFRVTCVNGLLFRDGQICEDCLGRTPLPGIAHRCYRGSLAGSAVVAATDIIHGMIGTWSRKIDRLIALNDFAHDKFVEAGLPRERLVVKPNFLSDPGQPPAGPRDGALFVGRLSPEKGVDVLLRAWNGLDMPLTIVGTGPEEQRLRALAGPQVTFAGHLAPAQVAERLRRAAMLVVPSLWYENFPMVIVEAFAHGVPALVSSGGALARIVTDGRDGWHFQMGDAADLARIVRHIGADPVALAGAGRMARSRYEEVMSPGANLVQLEAIYAAVQAERAGSDRRLRKLA